ncbi:nitrate- and nitrite sensing domain-containing protein [Streptomyces galilaeus]
MRRPRPTATLRIPFLARLRVGRKLMLLVLLPVTGMMAFTAFGAVSQWRDAQTLRDFRTATELSFRTTALTDVLARERIAAVKARLRPGPATLKERTGAQHTTDGALHAALLDTAGWTGPLDVPGRLDARSRQLRALRLQTGTGSLTAPQLAGQYDSIEHDLLELAATLESGRPTRTSGQAADAHIALLNAIEAAERERTELAVLFADPDAPHPIATDRWSALEKALLDDFGQTAPAGLRGRLYVALLQPPASSSAGPARRSPTRTPSGTPGPRTRVGFPRRPDASRRCVSSSTRPPRNSAATPRATWTPHARVGPATSPSR